MKLVISLLLLSVSSVPAQELLLDDFRDPSGVSAMGTRWEAFTDRVMGGRSDMQAGIMQIDGAPALRMSGDVSLENNGGFIQVRLPLATSGYFDGRSYTGVALEVRGSAGSYYIHLRDAGTRLPWAYFRQSLPVDDSWRVVRLPFEQFETDNVLVRSSRAVELRRLRSLAVVAAGEAFAADLQVRSLSLY